MKQLQDLSKEDLLKENEHLQKLINNLASKNAQLTVTISSLEVSNEQMMKELQNSDITDNK